MTLPQWRSVHPHDSLVPYAAGDDAGAGAWCVESVANADSAGSLIRRAVFYPPAVPAALILPDDRDSSRLVDGCVLGMISVEARGGSAPADAVLSDSIRSRLDAALGAATPAAREEAVVYRMSRRHWHAGAIHTGTARAHNSVFVVFAALPVADSSWDAYYRGRLDENAIRDWRDEMARRAVREAGLDTMEAWALLDAARRVAEWRPGFAKDTTVVPRLERWLQPAAGRSADQRAAILTLAHVALQRAARGPDIMADSGPGPALRERLNRVHAGIVYEQLGADFVYPGAWLHEALAIHAPGLPGEVATTLALDGGMDFGDCNDLVPDSVIAAGERALPRMRDARLVGAVRLILGDAYRDQYRLSRPDNPYAEYGIVTDSTTARRARQRALVHYRAGLASAGDQPGARPAYREAWRLLAGIDPLWLRFVSVCD